MNFYAHACIAMRESTAPRYLLGAMLPDLASATSARVLAVHDAELAAGVRHHHECDAAFHAAESFAALCGGALSLLETGGVPRGPARAVAHVGIELLLDGVLSHDGSAQETYRRALAAASREPLDELVAMRAPGEPARVSTALRRLSVAPVPDAFREPEFVVDRLTRLLERRPRLALRPGDLPAVRGFAHAYKAEVAAATPALLDEVLAGLGRRPTAQTPARR